VDVFQDQSPVYEEDIIVGVLPNVRFFNTTNAPEFTSIPSMLPAVPAQSMVGDLLIVAPLKTSPLSAQESSTGGVAVAWLIAVEISHGADCEHAVPVPFPTKNKPAAITGCVCKKTQETATSDAAMLEGLIGKLLS
jgi:hypothetical protein